LLVARAGEVVERDALAAHVWDDGTHVNYDDGLNYCVRRLRLALDDCARDPLYIETLARRGYRFLGRVEPLAAGGGRTRSRPRRILIGAACAVALIVTTVLVESRPNNHHEIAVRVLRAAHDLLF
jgi:DNA-binding winged helix-turn-helix (wHTH) protein